MYLPLYEWLSCLDGCSVGHSSRSVTEHLQMEFLVCVCVCVCVWREDLLKSRILYCCSIKRATYLCTTSMYTQQIKFNHHTHTHPLPGFSLIIIPTITSAHYIHICCNTIWPTFGNGMLRYIHDSGRHCYAPGRVTHLYH